MRKKAKKAKSKSATYARAQVLKPWRGSIWQSLQPVSPPIAIQAGTAVHGEGHFLGRCRVIPNGYKTKPTKAEKDRLEAAEAMYTIGQFMSNILYNLGQEDKCPESYKESILMYRKAWDAIPNKHLANQQLCRLGLRNGR